MYSIFIIQGGTVDRWDTYSITRAQHCLSELIGWKTGFFLLPFIFFIPPPRGMMYKNAGGIDLSDTLQQPPRTIQRRRQEQATQRRRRVRLGCGILPSYCRTCLASAAATCGHQSPSSWGLWSWEIEGSPMRLAVPRRTSWKHEQSMSYVSAGGRRGRFDI